MKAKEKSPITWRKVSRKYSEKTPQIIFPFAALPVKPLIYVGAGEGNRTLVTTVVVLSG